MMNFLLVGLVVRQQHKPTRYNSEFVRKFWGTGIDMIYYVFMFRVEPEKRCLGVCECDGRGIG